MTNKNGVGIVVQQDQYDVVGVSGMSDRLMAIRLIFADDIIHIVSAYAPQIGLLEANNILFWKIWSI